jgi:uncharacterized cupin superfamily protein
MTVQQPSVVVDPATLTAKVGSTYPGGFAEPCMGRARKALGDAAGLRNFGINLTELPPGTWSSQRHWHLKQDEFVYIVEGEVVLVTNAGETVLKAGMGAGFPANNGDGHHLINRSDKKAVYLEIGDRTEGDAGFYSDIDLLLPAASSPGAKRTFTHRDGKPY